MSSADTTASSKPLVVLKYSVVCPMCGTTSVQYRLNPRLFFNDSVDIDLQPRKFLCPKGCESLHPPLYHMWCCPKCFFAASHKNFSDPLKNTHMPADIVRKHLREAAQTNEAYAQVSKMLGGNVDVEQPSFAQAIRINLLAIYVFDQILPLLKQNFIVQARNYVRLAWLYRDLSERSAEQASARSDIEKMNKQLAPYWSQMPENELDAMRKALEYYGLTLEDVSVVKSIENRVNVLQQMARINFKIHEYRKAAELLRDVVVSARGVCTQLDRDLKATGQQARSLSSDESSEMVSLKRRLETLITDSENVLELSREALTEAQMKKASAIMAGMPGKPVEEIRTALVQGGIEVAVIARLIPAAGKKGLFKFLK